MKASILGITIAIFLMIFPFEAYAKVLPQSRGSKKAIAPRSVGQRIVVTPRLRNDRKALLVSFGNLQNATTISYMLVYKTNGQQEGAGGRVLPSEGNASRELLFGTCSKNVCRYHTNISNMKLEVTAKLTSGKNLIKRYKIRI